MMKIANVKLKSISAYSQSKYITIEKLPKEKRAVLEKVLRIIDRENKVGNG